MTYTAYKFSQHTSTDSRDTEYRLLAQVTARLLSLKESQAATNLEGKRDLIDAVLWNRNVWSALRSDLASDGNRLPKEIRGSLISIAIWVEKECLRIVEEKGDLDALIEVNRNIMAGLKPHQDEGEGGERHAQAVSDTTSSSSSVLGNFVAAV